MSTKVWTGEDDIEFSNDPNKLPGTLVSTFEFKEEHDLNRQYYSNSRLSKLIGNIQKTGKDVCVLVIETNRKET